MILGNGSVALPDLSYKLFISLNKQGMLIMAIRKVSKRVPKIEASEMPVALTPDVDTAAAPVVTPPQQVTELAPAPSPLPEPAKTAKPAKIRRAKLVRDSFTMPEAEHALIAGLKKRCLSLGVEAKKSEVLRAALAVLARLSDAEAAAAIQGLAVIKTGRPAKDGK